MSNYNEQYQYYIGKSVGEIKAKGYKMIIASLIFILVITFAWLVKQSLLLDEYRAKEQEPVESEVPNDIIKTVAHIELSSNDYELIYRNTEEDIAYYRYVGERNLLAIGDIVRLYNGDEFIVTSISRNGFTISGDSTLLMGVSGSAVLDSEGNQIGYVSTMYDSGDVFCIWS